MAILHNIRTVAKYEARTLRRSWFFRLFSIGSLTIFTFMNIGIFSPVGEEDWNLVSIPSSVPLINLYLLNIGQAIVVIFLAADFLKRDKKLDTNEVLYTRPMSNLEYVAGKTLGILRLFLGLNLVVLFIALTVNIISTTMTVDIMSYLYYLLIISVPTILFSLGLAFLMMSVIKNQAITFLLLLGMAFLNMLYLWFRMGSVFDYMAFGLPVFQSGMIGFENPGFIVSQRLLFFCLGSAFVLLTVLLFNRLPQSGFHTSLTVLLVVLFLGGAGYSGYKTFSHYSFSSKTKKDVLELNKQYENTVFAGISEASIEVIHSGETIEAVASMVLVNQSGQPLPKYVLSLNPSLQVSSVSSRNNELKFARTGHILEVEPSKSLGPAESDTIDVRYSGGINESYCYPNYSDNMKENPYRAAMINIRKRQAFLREEYVLLTPETHWYPVASLNYYPSNPARIKNDFTRYTLKVKDEQGLVPVSQGKKRSSGGFAVFEPDVPLTGISLVIGKYLSDTLRVDSLEFITYYYKGNDYYKKDLEELKDTIPTVVSKMMRDLEANFSAPYPFSSLSLIEVPVQFHSYPKSNTQTRSEVQPSIVFLPEKMSVLRNASFKKSFEQQKRWNARSNQVVTDKELRLRIFNNFLRSTFINGVNERMINGVPVNEPVRYLLGPSYYFFRNSFHSDEYPVMNSVFENHLQKVQQDQSGYSFWYGSLPENDRANLILKKYSFEQLLGKNPKGDSLRIVISMKGDWLFNLLRSRAGIEEFDGWLRKYLEDNAFTVVDIRKFENDLREKFGFGFYGLLEGWFLRNDQPGFLIDDPVLNEVIINDRTRYQATFTVTNTENVPGLLNISFRAGGQNQPAGNQPSEDDISHIILLDSLQSKQIGMLLDFEPRYMMVNTVYARNIPGQYNVPFDEAITAKRGAKPFEGEIVLDPGRTEPREIIVDNEDAGFRSGIISEISPLKKLFGIRKEDQQMYLSMIRNWNLPTYWQPVIQQLYYGKHVKSAVYTKSGSGENKVTWTTLLGKPGYYDVYCYVGKEINRMIVRRGSEEQSQQDMPFRDMHYKVYHDDGPEEIVVDFSTAEGGWNNLGRFYFSGDTARVELTNQSAGRAVIGDAVKWVMQE